MAQHTSRPTRIVILGGGFAGVYAYLRLHKLLHTTKNKEIVLINERDFFTFVPMIHEVATGTLLPSSIKQSLYVLPRCCLSRFIEGRIQQVDFDAKEALVRHTNPGAPLPAGGNTDTILPEERIPFDYCIMALGSDVNFFGVPGAAEFALTLNNVDDAKRLKNRIVESFEQATITKEEAERRRLLRFVIVGGGPTGVELAGEISDLVHGELHKAFPFLYPFAQIRLYEGNPRLMSSIDEWFSLKAQKILSRKKRVHIYCGTFVREITASGMRVGEEVIPAGTIIWTAGVKARDIPLIAERQIGRDQKKNRIMVNQFLQVPSYENVFVAGDQAQIEDKEGGQPYPMRAQFAVREGEKAAENITRRMAGKPLAEFMWNDQGLIISLGKGSAIARVFGVHFSGPFAWFLYRIAYLIKIVGLRAKLRTALEWLLNTFLPRDISKL